MNEGQRKKDLRQAELLEEMIRFDRGDTRRIQHFLKVWGYARTIGILEGMEPEELRVLETAAITHDIAICHCERTMGRCSGKLQEQEGPALARELLERLGYEESVTERVCYLIAHHHTYKDVQGLDYQILLEADFLVNAYEDTLDREAILAFRRNVFRTEAGIRLLNAQFDL